MTEDEYAAEMYKAFNRGYKERQPEIDALKSENERLRKETELVERLTVLVERVIDGYEQMSKRLSALEEK